MELSNRFVTAPEGERFARFLEWLVRRGRSRSTARSYRSDWQDLSMWWRRSQGDAFDGAQLTGPHAVAWGEAIEARGHSDATVSRRLAFARSYATWLALEGVLTPQTVKGMREGTARRRHSRGPKALTSEETNRLLAHVGERGCLRDQALFHVLLDTGLRVGELVDLAVGDVDFTAGELRLRGGRPRRVPLPTRAARKLAWSLGERGLLELPPSGEITLPASGGWPPGNMVSRPPTGDMPALREVPVSPMPLGVEGPPSGWPLFVGERGGLSANGVQRVVRKHTTFARIHATAQMLRHTFALGFYARTRDLVTLAEILGHETVETTRIYAHAVEAEERTAPPLATPALA
jgi:integrase/recombinase XerC